MDVSFPYHLFKLGKLVCASSWDFIECVGEVSKQHSTGQTSCHTLLLNFEFQVHVFKKTLFHT